MIGRGLHVGVCVGSMKVADTLTGIVVVAIKKLRPIVPCGPEEEFTAQTTCKHPCILPLLGFSPVNSHLFVVTRFVSSR